MFNIHEKMSQCAGANHVWASRVVIVTECHFVCIASYWKCTGRMFNKYNARGCFTHIIIYWHDVCSNVSSLTSSSNSNVCWRYNSAFLMTSTQVKTCSLTWTFLTRNGRRTVNNTLMWLGTGLLTHMQPPDGTLNNSLSINVNPKKRIPTGNVFKWLPVVLWNLN